ncbi:MAG: aminotransferase class V-fold PLP-dependent enzyme [Bacillota bacterium]
MRSVYLDNAATSYPKPEEVYRAVEGFMRRNGASSGRGGYARAAEADELVAATRRSLARLFGFGDPGRVVFTHNATEALNLAIAGLVEPGDRVVTTSMEHNAVWRCLRALEMDGVIEVEVVPCSGDGTLPLDRLEEALESETRLLVLVHASNVTGTIMPAAEAARLAAERGVVFLLDAAQTAGSLPVDVERSGIDLLAFPGHKGLLGPPGTGGLFVREGLQLRPRKWGGTGHAARPDTMPEFLPDRHEAGTLNVPGLVGLGAAVDYLLGRGLEAIRAHEKDLGARALELLGQVPRVTLYGPRDPSARVGVVSFNVEGLEPGEVARRLDVDHGIMVRAGLHCAPCACRTIGAEEHGTVRASFGPFNTDEDVESLVDAVQAIASGR